MEFIFCEIDSGFYILFQTMSVFRLKQSPASYYIYPGWIIGQSLWDLRWIKWHWDRSFDFDFPLSMPLHQCFILIFIFKYIPNRKTQENLSTFQQESQVTEVRIIIQEKHYVFPPPSPYDTPWLKWFVAVLTTKAWVQSQATLRIAVDKVELRET